MLWGGVHGGVGGGGVSFTSGYCREIYIARCSEICSFLLRFCLSILWMSPLGGT